MCTVEFQAKIFFIKT